jgi:SSS family solute:Na+ symporter
MAALATLAPGVVGADSLHAMPALLARILPVGLLGLVIAAMLAADMSTDSSYMLTWGSVIYNDILAPFRRKQSERTGILINRFIIAGIGMFLLFWGLWFRLGGSLWYYLQITGTIYLSSMFVLLVACCYWRPANNWGAIGAIITGAVLPVTSLALNQQIKVSTPDGPVGWSTYYIGDHWVNIGTYAAVAIAMVIGSLLKNLLGGESPRALSSDVAGLKGAHHGNT